jgi:hypothetical protein
VKEGAEVVAEGEEAEAKKEEVVEEVKAEEVEDEGPDVFINLDDYLKTKKTVKTAETREHVKIDDKNTLVHTGEKQLTKFEPR